MPKRIRQEFAIIRAVHDGSTAMDEITKGIRSAEITAYDAPSYKVSTDVILTLVFNE